MTTIDLYWLFSTIAQTFGAIVALIGMIAVYRFQNINNSINSFMDQSFDDRMKIFPDVLTQSPNQFIIDMHDKYSHVIAHPKKQPAVLLELAKSTFMIEALMDLHERIKFRFFLFLIPHLLFIILSILALLHCNWLSNWKFWVLNITGLCLLSSFGLTIFLCYSLIESKQKVPKPKQ